MASTPTYAWPTPDDTDPVGDGALDMRTLGNSIDSTVSSLLGTPANYTPVWTSTGTAPNIGNGFISGHFFEINKLAYVNIFVVMGSTTTYGTGNYRFSVPATATINSSVTNAGTAILYDASAGYPGAFGGCTRVSATTVNISPSGANETTNLLPFVWGNADQIRLLLVYRTD